MVLEDSVIEPMLRAAETALRPFVTMTQRVVEFDSPAVIATYRAFKANAMT